MCIRDSCRGYGVPKPTLKRRLEGKNKIACGNLKTFGRPVDHPSEIEKDLVEHILFMESNLLGCTRADLQRLAFQIAEANSLQHRFKNGKSGKNDSMGSWPAIQNCLYGNQTQHQQQEPLGSIKMLSRYFLINLKM